MQSNMDLVATVIREFHPLVWCVMQEILNGNGTYARYILDFQMFFFHWTSSVFSHPYWFIVKPMRLKPRSRILLQSKLHLVKVVHVVAVQSLLLKWCYPRDVNGIASASSAKTAPRHLIQSSHAMVLTRTFIVKLVMARNGDLMAMDLPVVLDFCKLMDKGGHHQITGHWFYNGFINILARMMSTPTARLLSTAQQQLRQLMVKVAHDVVAQCLPLNNNSLREQCGTRSASIVTNVIVHWIQCALVMALIRRSIADHVTDACLDQKVLDMDTRQLCHPTVNPHWTCKLNIMMNYQRARPSSCFL